MKRKFTLTLLSLLSSLTILCGCGADSSLNSQSENSLSESSISNNTALNNDESTSLNASDSDKPNQTSDESYTKETHDYAPKEITNITINSNSYNLPETAEESSVYIEAIENLPDDFIKGVDASEVLAIENSGGIYYDQNGNEEDLFAILASEGVNYIRLRIWNDPYDLDGNGYGGGNCDLATAIELGKRATKEGMKVMIDFHYSDFWADPDRQLVPKAWANFSIDDKSAALYDFTYDSLEELITAGVNVTMVQVGNETNNGMAGESNSDKVAILQKSGSQAVRDISNVYDKDIKVCLHYTNSTDYDRIDNICASLEKNQVDYDIMALSYYCYWSGSFEQFQKSASHIKDEYGKDTILVEFSYPYTADDSDYYNNSAAGGEMELGYSSTVQSQATFIRDTCKLALDSQCIGAFYWGGCWIAATGANLEENKLIWEKYGCGWASSYASDYDPEFVGDYYGGSAWDNQALFDSSGKALASLDAFKYLSVGTICDSCIDYVPDISFQCLVGEEVNLPDSIPAIFNNRKYNSNVAVCWNEDELNAIDTSADGEYVISGYVNTDNNDKLTVKCTVTVGYINIAENYSFEDDNYDMWTVDYEGNSNPTDFQNNAADASTGDVAFHYWSEDSMDFTISQTLNDLENGTYMLSVASQGGDVDDSCQMTLYAISGGKEYTIDFMNTSWNDWQTPVIYDIPVEDGTITFGVHIKACPKCWGTLDDFSLCRTK